tara:strand:+ start:8170 stop:8310 length:141 start_codon:yes stop_codon:yes gene_type:complete
MILNVDSCEKRGGYLGVFLGFGLFQIVGDFGKKRLRGFLTDGYMAV